MTSELRLHLRKLRQAKTLSQEELAQALGISRQSIISLEQGEYLPSFPLFTAMIEFFNCDIAELVEGINLQKITNEKGGDNNIMQITPWNPFQAIDRMQDEMSDVVERTIGRADWSRAFSSSVGAMNIHEDDQEYEIEIQTPGFKEDEVNVEVAEDGTITVSGERKEEKKESTKSVVRREFETAEFSRTVHFPIPVAADKVEAKLDNGSLRIVAPKIAPVRPKTTKITVKKNK
jgi:HSP20 family protein